MMSHNRFSASDERMEYIKHILCTKAVRLPLVGAMEINIPRYCQSLKLQSYLHYFMSMRYNEAAQHISVGGRIRNKPNTINTGHVLVTYNTACITILCQVD